VSAVQVRAAEHVARAGEITSTVRLCEDYDLHTREPTNGHRATQLKLVFAVTGLTEEFTPGPVFTAFLAHSVLKFPAMILYLVMPLDSHVGVCNAVLLWPWAVRELTRSIPSRVIFVDDRPQGLGEVWQHLPRL
jgi:hypothetical protein